MFNLFKKEKKNEPLAWGSEVEFDVDGGYSVHAKLGTKCKWAWCVTVYFGGDVVARRQSTVWPSCPDELTLEYLQRIYNRDYLEKLAKNRTWLLANRVPECLWDVAVSASDDFLVVRILDDPRLYRIYPREANGEVHPLLGFKEFYGFGGIRSPKDFPPEEIKEKWQEWHYRNEYFVHRSYIDA